MKYERKRTLVAKSVAFQMKCFRDKFFSLRYIFVHDAQVLVYVTHKMRAKRRRPDD